LRERHFGKVGGFGVIEHVEVVVDVDVYAGVIRGGVEEGFGDVDVGVYGESGIVVVYDNVVVVIVIVIVVIVIIVIS